MDNDELRRAVAVLDAYKAQLDSMARQSQVLQISLEETARARDTLKAFENAAEGDELLVPIGASSFVSVTVGAKRDVVVGIGTKVSVEKSPEDAMEYLVNGLAEIGDALKKLGGAMAEMQKKAEELAVGIQGEYQRRQQ